MTGDDVHAALARAHATGHKVQLARESDHEHWNGFVLGLSRELVYLRVLDNFTFTEFGVLRLTDIADVRSGPTERFFERVLKAEGRLDDLRPAPALDLTSVDTVLGELLERDPFVTIEDEDQFHLGRLDAVGGQRVRLTYMRPDGTIEPAPRVIDTAAIVVVTFAGDYVTMFRKHGAW